MVDVIHKTNLEKQALLPMNRVHLLYEMACIPRYLIIVSLT